MQNRRGCGFDEEAAQRCGQSQGPTRAGGLPAKSCCHPRPRGGRKGQFSGSGCACSMGEGFRENWGPLGKKAATATPQPSRDGLRLKTLGPHCPVSQLTPRPASLGPEGAGEEGCGAGGRWEQQEHLPRAMQPAQGWATRLSLTQRKGFPASRLSDHFMLWSPRCLIPTDAPARE